MATETTNKKAANPKERLLVARRSLPNSRALIGALLVTIAAVGAFVFANRGDGGPVNAYLALANSVKPGDVIAAGDLSSQPMTLSPELAAHAFESSASSQASSQEVIAEVVGATALRHLGGGELLLAADLRLPTAGADALDIHEVTLPVPLSRTPSLLKLGDKVTILAHDPENNLTWVALEDVTVLEFATESEAIGSGGSAQLTLELDSAEEVLRAVHLSALEMTVVLTTHAQTDEYGEHYTLSPPPEILQAQGNALYQDEFLYPDEPLYPDEAQSFPNEAPFPLADASFPPIANSPP